MIQFAYIFMHTVLQAANRYYLQSSTITTNQKMKSINRCLTEKKVRNYKKRNNKQRKHVHNIFKFIKQNTGGERDIKLTPKC